MGEKKHEMKLSTLTTDLLGFYSDLCKGASDTNNILAFKNIEMLAKTISAVEAIKQSFINQEKLQEVMESITPFVKDTVDAIAKAIEERKKNDNNEG